MLLLLIVPMVIQQKDLVVISFHRDPEALGREIRQIGEKAGPRPEGGYLMSGFGLALLERSGRQIQVLPWQIITAGQKCMLTRICLILICSLSGTGWRRIMVIRSLHVNSEQD